MVPPDFIQTLDFTNYEEQGLPSLCDTFSIRSLFRSSIRSSKKAETGLYGLKFAILIFTISKQRLKRFLLGQIDRFIIILNAK